MNTSNHTHPGIALVLAMAMALGPLALDTYLPAFPAMASDFGVSVHQVSLTISLYVFVMAFGQLFGGPMSDRFGRDRIMLLGMAVFSAASLLISLSDALNEVLILRIIQAFGGGWAMVCVPALVRDRLSGQEAARFFSLIGLMMVIAPAVAPTIGSALLAYTGWSGIFAFLCLYSFVVLLLLRLLVFRGYQRPPHEAHVSVISRYRSVLATRPAMRFMLTGAMGFSVMLLFITHASFIYQEHFGVSPKVFALLFGANVVLMLVMNLTSRRLLRRLMPARILRWVVTLQFAALILLLTVTAADAGLWLFVPAMVLSIGVLGAVSPNTQACYMEFFPQHGGTAAALMGATQFSLAGLISAASTLLPESVLSIVLAQIACSAICVLLMWSGRPAIREAAAAR